MVLDIMMPEVNGYDIVKEMKRQKLDIPFIYLTAKTQEHDTIYALTLGADDYVKNHLVQGNSFYVLIIYLQE